MTGLKVALSVAGMAVGSGVSVTGVIFANIPPISSETPVNVTLAIVVSCLIGTGALAWKVSRAWYTMEAKVTSLETEVTSLKRSRSAAIAAKLKAYEEQLHREELNNPPV
jgi:hypothetical protein